MRSRTLTRLAAVTATFVAAAFAASSAQAEPVNSAPDWKPGQYSATAVITKKQGSYLEFSAAEFQYRDILLENPPVIVFKSPNPVIFGGYVPNDAVFEGGRGFVLDNAATVWLSGTLRDPNEPSAGPRGMPALNLEKVMVAQFKNKPQPPKPGDDQKNKKGDDQNTQGDQGDDQGDGPDLPSFKPAFLNRVWTARAEVNGYDDGQLDLTVSKFEGLPKQFRAQDDDLVEEAGIGLVTKNTRVYKKKSGEYVQVKAGRDNALDDADRVRVKIKVLRPSQWEEDEDGAPVPTFAVKRVYILS